MYNNAELMCSDAAENGQLVFKLDTTSEGVFFVIAMRWISMLIYLVWL